MDLFLLFLCFSGVFVNVFGLEPSFDVFVDYVTAVAGDVAILPCSINNLGEYRVSWLDPRNRLLYLMDKRFINDSRVSIERPFIRYWNIHIMEISYSDQGQYMCQINTKPVKIKIVRLIVQVPARIIHELSSHDQIVGEGDTVTLICKVIGVPTPNVTWYKITNECKQAKERIDNIGEVLEIHNVSRFSDGTYECVADNNVKSADSWQIKIGVWFAPEIYFPVKRTGQYPGHDVVLDCEVVARPRAFVSWKKGDTIVDPLQNERFKLDLSYEDKQRTRLSLRVIDIKPDDFGIYTCYAVNVIDRVTESLVLYDLRDWTTTLRTTSEAAHDLRDWTTTLRTTSEAVHDLRDWTTTLRTTSEAAQDHVTLTSAVYTLSLITPLLVPAWCL